MCIYKQVNPPLSKPFIMITVDTEHPANLIIIIATIIVLLILLCVLNCVYNWCTCIKDVLCCPITCVQRLRR
jgi:hypothetical protein